MVELFGVSPYAARLGIGVCWIGLNDLGREGTYIWNDGTAVSYTDWNSREPSANEGEDCVRLVSGGWSDLICSNEFRCICELYLN